MSLPILEQYIKQVIVEVVHNSTRVIDKDQVHLTEREYTVHEESEWDFIIQELGDDIEITQPWNGKTGMFKTTMPNWELQGALVNNQVARRDRPVVPRQSKPPAKTSVTRKNPCPPCPPCPPTGAETKKRTKRRN